MLYDICGAWPLGEPPCGRAARFAARAAAWRCAARADAWRRTFWGA